VDGTATVTLCTGYCLASWDTSGGFVYFIFPQVKDGAYALPVMRDSGLPRIPLSATSIEDITSQKAITVIPWEVESAVNPTVYAYTRLNTRRTFTASVLAIDFKVNATKRFDQFEADDR
jgi:hypothetical protein